MKITESQLRRVIQEVIKEVSASEDEAILSPFVSMPPGDGGSSVDHRKIEQLFAAWCRKNDLKFFNYEESIDMFKKDHAHIFNELELETLEEVNFNRIFMKEREVQWNLAHYFKKR